jgi:hypothetical protein
VRKPRPVSLVVLFLVAALLVAAGPIYALWRVATNPAEKPPGLDPNRVITQEERQAAADRAAAAGAETAAAPAIGPGDTPDYFGSPNYALSPLPQDDGTGGVVPGTGIRKFVDALPGIAAAVPDKATFPGSDY